MTARAPRASVLEVLGRESLRAWVAPEADDCTVFSEALSDAGDRGAIERMGARLSVRLRSPLLTVLDENDEALGVWLFGGGLIRAFHGVPTAAFADGPLSEPPQMVASAIARAFERPDATAALARVLSASALPVIGFPLAIDRHRALCRALGLPEAIAGFGYRNAEEGDIHPGSVLDASTRL